MAKVQKPQIVVKYYLTVNISERKPYSVLDHAEHFINAEIPLKAAGALDLNVIASALLEECVNELKEEQEQPNDTTA